MSLCMYVYICVCMCVYMYVDVCMFMYMYVRIYIYIYIYACVHVCMYVCMYTCDKAHVFLASSSTWNDVVCCCVRGSGPLGLQLRDSRE